MKKIKILSALLTGTLASFAVGTTAMAQSSDALIDKLVEKGILNVKEANDLREEADKDFTKSYSVKSGMPDWVTALKFNGDFRGRYDGIYSRDGSDRNRLRYRMRFGATASLTDNFEVGLRLGSGQIGSAAPSLGGSPFSANTDLGNDGSRKFLFVDLAYAKWTPNNAVEMQLGKMASAFWFTDMVFDPDYNPEGGQEKFTYEINDRQALHFTAGQFVIAENFVSSGAGRNNDAYLFMNQVDWTAAWTKRFSTRAGVGIYNFKNQRAIPASLETFINQNGTPAVGTGSQNFNPIIARAEATYALESFPRFEGEFPITIGGEYANNPAANNAKFTGKKYRGSDNQAYNLGVTFGSAKHKGNWQISYNYKNIETAALWHGINDDDFGFGAKGGTDVRGHQVIASYHVREPLTLNLRYMRTEQINNAPGKPNEQDRIFFDLLWAF